MITATAKPDAISLADLSDLDPEALEEDALHAPNSPTAERTAVLSGGRTSDSWLAQSVTSSEATAPSTEDVLTRPRRTRHLAPSSLSTADGAPTLPSGTEPAEPAMAAEPFEDDEGDVEAEILTANTPISFRKAEPPPTSVAAPPPRPSAPRPSAPAAARGRPTRWVDEPPSQPAPQPPAARPPAPAPAPPPAPPPAALQPQPAPQPSTLATTPLEVRSNVGNLSERIAARVVAKVSAQLADLATQVADRVADRVAVAVGTAMANSVHAKVEQKLRDSR
jgi:hypothetical protein